jgi:hypothetical protein
MLGNNMIFLYPMSRRDGVRSHNTLMRIWWEDTGRGTRDIDGR